MAVDDIKNKILEREKNLTIAEKTGDKKALSGLLDETFIGVMANGNRVSKHDFISAFCGSHMTFASLEIENLDIRVSLDQAIVVGRSIFQVTVNGNNINASAQFIDYWSLKGENWRLVASSATPEKSA